jgi:hypothetical protein
MITAACILLVAALSMFATYAWCRADIDEAERERDRAEAKADHYRSSYLAAISARPPVPVSDPLWVEFLGEQWTP